MEPSQRIEKVISYLKMNPNSFSKSLGFSRSDIIYNVLNSKNGVSRSLASKITEVYPNINAKWLTDEVGAMLTLPKFPEDGTPMYESAATASGVEVYDDLNRNGPAFYVNIPQFRDCSFGKMVYGHSMYPTIESGTYVFCKPVTDKFTIVPGEVYYIEYDNFGVCKRLQHSEKDGEYIAESDNDEVRKDGHRRYRPYSIPIDKIRHIFLVKGFFKQSQN